jgi:RNA polymerase subunit RPABC4/transcription elongation factor Spt4
VIIYRILRPSETVAEASERALAEEAMMVEIESQPHCANCSRQVHEDWIICPTCRNRLRRVCPNCSRLVELDWSLCAWCGKDFERPELIQEVAVPPPVGRPLRAGEPSAYPAQPTNVPAISSSSLDSRALDGRAPERTPRPAAGEH